MTPHDLVVVRLLQTRIARSVGVSESTVSRVLARAGLSKLSNPEPVEPVVHYEHEAPGDLLHIDTKKLGRIARPSHRVTGNRRDSVDGAGWETLFVAIDDHAGLAFTAMHPDEKTPQAVLFLRNAVAERPNELVVSRSACIPRLLVLRNKVPEAVFLNARVDAALSIARCDGVPERIAKGMPRGRTEVTDSCSHDSGDARAKRINSRKHLTAFWTRFVRAAAIVSNDMIQAIERRFGMRSDGRFVPPIPPSSLAPATNPLSRFKPCGPTGFTARGSPITAGVIQ